MDPQILAIVLLICGFVLIFAELLVPSGGIIAVICAACFAGSVYSAYVAWWETSPAYWWTYIVSVAILIPAAVVGAFRVLTHTSFGNRVLLSAPSESEVTPYQREQEHLSGLIGQRGVALTLMTPGGLVKVEEERLHAVSDGLLIEPNQEVEVVSVRGTRVVVRPVDALEESSPAVAFDQESPEDGDEDGLDPWLPDEKQG